MLALLVPLALLVGCGGDEGSSNKDTTKPATENTTEAKSFVLYTGRDEELIGPIIAAFEKESGVKVDVRYGNSAEMAAQLLEEGDSTPADAFLSQEVGAIGALADADLLGDLPAATVERAEVRFRPVEGTKWVGVTARSRVIAYNPEMLETAGVPVPTGVEDLTDPTYEGMVAMVPTNASFQAFITAFRITKGEEAAKACAVRHNASDPRGLAPSDSAALSRVARTSPNTYVSMAGLTYTLRQAALNATMSSPDTTGLVSSNGSTSRKRRSTSRSSSAAG